MAVNTRRTGRDGSDVQEGRVQFNKLHAEVTALRTTVAAMLTAAGTSLAAVAAVAQPAAMTSQQVADMDGNTT